MNDESVKLTIHGPIQTVEGRVGDLFVQFVVSWKPLRVEYPPAQEGGRDDADGVSDGQPQQHLDVLGRLL